MRCIDSAGGRCTALRGDPYIPTRPSVGETWPRRPVPPEHGLPRSRWPDCRNALSQCRQAITTIPIESEESRLRLAPRVKVDFKEALGHARSVGCSDALLDTDPEMTISALSGSSAV